MAFKLDGELRRKLVKRDKCSNLIQQVAAQISYAQQAI